MYDALTTEDTIGSLGRKTGMDCQCDTGSLDFHNSVGELYGL